MDSIVGSRNDEPAVPGSNTRIMCHLLVHMSTLIVISPLSFRLHVLH